MTKPDGSLTGTQLEIMEVVWQANGTPLKVSDIWQQLTRHRKVARTTILTMVQRLEKRNWLRRSNEDVARYRATCTRDEAAGRLANTFVDEFFGGSASQLVSSLLGSRRIKKGELARLRKLLGEVKKK